MKREGVRFESVNRKTAKGATARARKIPDFALPSSKPVAGPF